MNAAGISQSSLNIVTRWETTQQTINTNLSATIGLCKAFSVINLRRSRQPSNMSNNSPGIRRPDLDEASRQGSGTADLGSPCIINIASLLGIKGGYGATAYAASKAGVLGFTRALVCELGQQAHINVRVNALVPGYIDTPMTQGKYMHHQADLFYGFDSLSIPISCCLRSFFQLLSRSSCWDTHRGPNFKPSTRARQLRLFY